MPVLNCYISDEDSRLLERISEETGRKQDELAEAAISEAINGYYRRTPLKGDAS